MMDHATLLDRGATLKGEVLADKMGRSTTQRRGGEIRGQIQTLRRHVHSERSW